MSESDIQFYYQANLRAEIFAKMIEKQQEITISYAEFLDTFTKLIEDCQFYGQQYKVKFILDDDEGKANLVFILDAEIKESELFRIDCFRQIDDEKIAN